MRYVFLSDVGGFLWWLFVKFTKTSLEEELGKDKWARNIFTLIIAILLVTFVSVKFF